jgi:hypothetical protein
MWLPRRVSSRVIVFGKPDNGVGTMLCMCCKKMVDRTYFVTQEEAQGKPIEGPMICLPCYAKSFPGKSLPPCAYIYSDRSVEPIRLGQPHPVHATPLLGSAFVTPQIHSVQKYTIETALQKIANDSPTSCTVFSWGPRKFNLKWAESIISNVVIEYSIVSGKESCAQGLGIYVAQKIWSSASYGNTDDTSILMLTCTDVPTLDYSSKSAKTQLAKLVTEMTGVTITADVLLEYLNSTACLTRAIKKYGNYWAVTTGKGVVPTLEFEPIRRAVSANDVVLAKNGHDCAKKCLEDLGFK